LPVTTIETAAVNVPAGYVKFALVEVHFSQEVNGVKYPLESKNLNACYISDAV